MRSEGGTTSRDGDALIYAAPRPHGFERNNVGGDDQLKPVCSVFMVRRRIQSALGFLFVGISKVEEPLVHVCT